MPHLDWTIHLSDLFVFIGGGFVFVKAFLSVRDAIRDLTLAVGSGNPPRGLIGDVHALKVENRQHREWLIRAGIDRASAHAHGHDGEQ